MSRVFISLKIGEDSLMEKQSIRHCLKQGLYSKIKNAAFKYWLMRVLMATS